MLPLTITIQGRKNNIHMVLMDGMTSSQVFRLHGAEMTEIHLLFYSNLIIQHI
jgi:hypothetical protein